MNINSINRSGKTVYFDNGSSINHTEFMKKFTMFFQNRIAGETLIPTDMEHFMRRTSGKTLELLMKGKKYEGYMEGVSDKLLTKGQKIALATVVTLIMVGVIVFVVLRNEGVM